ncbi:Pachytene checkpoint protein 2 [Intoshia linei]|uniref:Pachytene checkpoint protein 2 n=1 Tax=Intoshia linei TaxID=1819745 RepID=A0A177B5Z0_9BILA|nr:Pachytene checkpoint protein 2 [Intoshia linei]
MTYIKLSQKMLNSELFGLNKIILLHGPAGSGKTSLCCGLAQKAAAMLYNQYQDIYLIEINSQNLFSKWFSESGKLVSKLFSEMNEMLQNKDNMIFLLIDEVESLISSRIMSMNSNEPSDSIRVVNSVLMHIDRIKRHNNILILSTSNILEAIDNAFIDRVDLKLFVDHPAEPSINKILTNSIQQLVTNDILSLNNEIVDDEIKRLSKMCVGISGRKIKKLPFLSLSKCYTNNNSIQFSKFMEKSIEEAIKAKSINKNLNQKTTFNGLSPFST